MGQAILSEREKLTLHLNYLHENVRKVREMCQVICDEQEAKIAEIQAVLASLPEPEIPASDERS